MAVCLAFSRAPLTSPNRCDSPQGIPASTASAIRRSYRTTAFAKPNLLVTAYEPHRRYAVRSSWTARACFLTESHEVTRPVGGIGWLVIERLFGAHDRTPDRRRCLAEDPGCAQGAGRGPAPGPGL